MRLHPFLSRLTLAALIVLTAVGSVTAKPPWQLVSLRRIEADETKEYRLQEESGPWLIFAASFAGEGAAGEARNLVLELRRRYKVPAYIHSERFDFSESVRGIGINPDRSPKMMKYDKSGVFDEYAVLIGDFASVDDPDLQKVLQRIKYARPQVLTGENKSTTRRYAGFRELQRRINGDDEKKRKGPMGTAFATPNPLLPREYFAPSGIDTFVLDMNKDVPHSLLECPGKFSVRVATFRGTVEIDQRRVSEIENGGSMKSRLEEAAIKAHRLTEALRDKNIEAYEFHDRHESYVTVGSFDWVGKPQADGVQEMNPAVLKVINHFSPSREALADRSGQTVAGLQPRSLAGIPFDVQPWPVEVPRRSIAADYATR